MTPGLLSAMVLLDLLVGDPRRWPHPVVWIGRLIGWLEGGALDKMKNRRRAGILLVALVLIATWLGSALLLEVAASFAAGLYWLVALWLGWSCLALRSLHGESRAVIVELEAGNLVAARQALAMIVGRDTSHLDEEQILKATLETVAENTSDGVIAPLCYLIIGGPVLGLLYKAVSTLDSMVGYRTDRYREFGWAAARLDDLLNFVPARLTGALFVVAALPLRLKAFHALQVMRRDAPKHASPNAGWPEAAAAGALGVQLGGPAVYFGQPVRKPTFGDALERPTPGHYRQLIVVLYLSSFGALALGLLILQGLA